MRCACTVVVLSSFHKCSKSKGGCSPAQVISCLSKCVLYSVQVQQYNSCCWYDDDVVFGPTCFFFMTFSLKKNLSTRRKKYSISWYGQLVVVPPYKLKYRGFFARYCFSCVQYLSVPTIQQKHPSGKKETYSYNLHNKLHHILVYQGWGFPK